MRVADYITNKLYEAGGEHVFLVTGGMIMHLTDALLQHRKQKYICHHHEQAAVMAADAYARYTGKLGVAYVTAGPGALNTITGVVGALVDSAPCVIVAGQSKVSQAKVIGPRQFPLQGFNNLPLFKHITKYAVMLDDISKVKYEVEKAIYIAKEHRVGPVYIECPIDIQGATFDPDKYQGYTPDKTLNTFSKENDKKIEHIKEAIIKSKRPCIMAGAGIRLSNCVEQLHQFAEKANIPVLTSRLGMDLIDHNHPLFVGRPGTYGERSANFTIQKSDLLIVLGCRMGIGILGYGDPKLFAPNAFKICVDVDQLEMDKPSLKFDIPLKMDAREFLEKIIPSLPDNLSHKNWVDRTQSWKNKYPVDLPEYASEKDGINSYHFTRLFSEKMSKDSVFVVDTGSCFHVHAQAFKVKYGQRHIITGGLSTMGYSPASIGVAEAMNGKKDVYCISGDGSIQMNMQEFMTIAFNKLPVKTLIYNNDGYLLIRHTQKNFCAGHLIGESKETGVGFPDMKKIANAYGIHHILISNLKELDTKLNELIEYNGPVICEIKNPPWQALIPRVASKQHEDGRMESMPYDDMFPFLPRDEYASIGVE